MDNSKHLTLLSVLFLTFDSILFLLGIGFFSGFSLIGNLVNNTTASTVLSYVGTGIGTLLLIISIPGIITGIGLMLRKSWSRIMALILCTIKLFNIPFGTALGIYGIWLLMQNESINSLNK
jgi:hypothetical protein